MSEPVRTESTAGRREPDGRIAEPAPARVAIVADFLEEQWPSMDLVADMLTSELETLRPGGMRAAKLQPPMRWRFSRLPGLQNNRPAKNADRLLNRFRDYPGWLRDSVQKFDVFHLADHSYSHLIGVLPPERTVVTCHDLDTFRCLVDPERDPRPAWFRAMTRRILDGFQKAAHVIAVSNATRAELLGYGLIPPERISVVPNGVHPSCSPVPDRAADAIAGRLIAGEKDEVVVLNVGSGLGRKRLDVLLRVFAAVRTEVPGLRLVQVGGLTSDHIELAGQLGLDRAIAHLPFLERAVLAAVYRRAALLLHTAEAEGFGLPLIEAMACGCPVVASDIAVLREVGGPASTYCPVADVELWKKAVAGRLSERAQDTRAWRIRSEEGLAWAARFSWAENARRSADIYQKVIQRNS